MARQGLWLGLIGLLVIGAWSWPTSHRWLAARLYNNVGAAYASGALGAGGATTALDWYRRAAAEGSAAAAFNLGFAFQNGAGTPADEAEAARWYARAADAGSALAAHNLAVLYANPGRGRPRLALADLWIRRAATLDDGTLAKTIEATRSAMEQDMSARQRAASADPARAARLDAPPPPARAPRDDAQLQQQVEAALAAAAPLHAAVDRYIAGHHALPTDAAVADDPAFDPTDTPDAHVGLGAGGMVSATLRAGPYAGEEIGWAPLLRAGQLSWVCMHGRVPTRYFGASCR